MLSRRQLRIKVMESLYAYFSDDMGDKKAQYDELTSVFDHILNLYYHQLSLLVQLRARVEHTLERAKHKNIPSSADLNPNMRFVNNAILNSFRKDKKLEILLEDRKIAWGKDEDLISKTAKGIKASNEYLEYLEIEDPTFEDDRKFLKRIFKKQVMENELWDNYYSEGNLFWASNIDIANRLVLDTIDAYQLASTALTSPRSHIYTKLLSKEEQTFVKRLFDRTIENDKEYEAWISDKAKNWETDRIASMDMLLMKMALCEVLDFPIIPVKVSMNEYIEISKRYSAPESKSFINGVLDKIITDLRKDDKIKKKGKGLIES